MPAFPLCLDLPIQAKEEQAHGKPSDEASAPYNKVLEAVQNIQTVTDPG
jgi:hypothetical protein